MSARASSTWRASPRAPATRTARGSHTRTDVIGICASTGGPRVLERVLARLPAGYGIPILVVQHIAPGFLPGLVSWLGEKLALPVAQACDGGALVPGVWFAPDGAHLRLATGRRLALDRGTQTTWHKPSGDVLLLSLAEVAGANAVAVILTGMGRDGADGLAAVAAAGGRTIAQDQDSSSVYGMPRMAAERGAQSILAPAAIGDELAALDRGGVTR